MNAPTETTSLLNARSPCLRSFTRQRPDTGTRRAWQSRLHQLFRPSPAVQRVAAVLRSQGDLEYSPGHDTLEVVRQAGSGSH